MWRVRLHWNIFLLWSGNGEIEMYVREQVCFPSSESFSWLLTLQDLGKLSRGFDYLFNKQLVCIHREMLIVEGSWRWRSLGSQMERGGSIQGNCSIFYLNFSPLLCMDWSSCLWKWRYMEVNQQRRWLSVLAWEHNTHGLQVRRNCLLVRYLVCVTDSWADVSKISEQVRNQILECDLLVLDCLRLDTKHPSHFILDDALQEIRWDLLLYSVNCAAWSDPRRPSLLDAITQVIPTSNIVHVNSLSWSQRCESHVGRHQTEGEHWHSICIWWTEIFTPTIEAKQSIMKYSSSIETHHCNSYKQTVIHSCFCWNSITQIFYCTFILVPLCYISRSSCPLCNISTFQFFWIAHFFFFISSLLVLSMNDLYLHFIWESSIFWSVVPNPHLHSLKCWTSHVKQSSIRSHSKDYLCIPLEIQQFSNLLKYITNLQASSFTFLKLLNVDNALNMWNSSYPNVIKNAPRTKSFFSVEVSEGDSMEPFKSQRQSNEKNSRKFSPHGHLQCFRFGDVVPRVHPTSPIPFERLEIVS